MFSIIQENAVVLSAFGRFPRKEKKVRVSKDADNFVQVKVVAANRDAKSGKMIYETESTTKVFDATAETVSKVVYSALENASNSGGGKK